MKGSEGENPVVLIPLGIEFYQYNTLALSLSKMRSLNQDK